MCLRFFIKNCPYIHSYNANTILIINYADSLLYDSLHGNEGIMDKAKKNKMNKGQRKLEGQADISDSDNSIKLDHQNQQHNVKKVSLGPNTKR